MIRSFEELESWKSARLLVKEIYAMSNTGAFRRDYPLRDQIRKAAISVMANIAEGSERNNKREFIYFLGISKGSCGEVRSLLYIALDQNYILHDLFDIMVDLTKRILSLIAGMINYLKKS
jgi:four helix bundle protein